MTPRALVFDLDETLYRERRFALSGYLAVARRVEADTGAHAAEVFSSLASSLRGGRRPVAFQEMCARFGLDASRIPAWLDVYRGHAPRLRLAAAVAALLRELRASWRLGVLTNGLPPVQRAKARALRLEDAVDAVVFAEEHGTGVGKPDPSAFLETLARLDAVPGRSVFVGDDLVRDVAGARGVGMRTVWLRRGSGGGCRTAPRADAVIASLLELPGILAALRLEEVQHAH